MAVVAGLCFVFNGGGVDGDASALLFRSLVDFSVGVELCLAFLRQVLRNRSSQRRLPVIDVAWLRSQSYQWCPR